ncbi:MAG: NAD(P)-dependent oxidoreductase [Saprospiraceae bacterium]|nr:NAD(P)-dependent oxidoreductase [Saprospiraceae bacterium]
MKSERPEILITDAVHDCLIEGLEKEGYKVRYDTEISPGEVKGILHRFEGIVISSRMIMDKKMIENGRRLKFIARLGSGKEIIDLDHAAKKGISVITSPEGNANAVAEHVIGMLLTLMNKIHIGDRNVRNFIWKREENRGTELEGKTVGIIGFGHTGSKVAEKLGSFNVKVLAYDKYKKHFADDLRYVEETSLEDVQARSEILSLHVPLTKETTGMVNGSFLESCKKGLILVNTSRGHVVNTMDLILSIESEHLAGAALDVFENEKPATMTQEEKEMYQRLFRLDNTLLSPHVAGWTFESKRKLAETVLDKIRRL